MDALLEHLASIHELPDCTVEYPDEYGAAVYVRGSRTLVGKSILDRVVCDFCSDHPVVVRYPCESFTLSGLLGGQDMVMRGSWAACRTCHDFIEGGLEKQLTLRAAERYHIDPQSFQGLALSILHLQFFLRRTGPARRYPE